MYVKIRIDDSVTQFKNALKDCTSIHSDGMSKIGLLYSHHFQIFQIWYKIYEKLDKYSFLMDKFCTTQQIQQYEKNINSNNTDHDKELKEDIDIEPDEQTSIWPFELPANLRVSFMICNGILFPNIVSRRNEIIQCDLAICPEMALLPLNKWYFLIDSWIYKFFEDDHYNGLDRLEARLDEFAIDLQYRTR